MSERRRTSLASINLHAVRDDEQARRDRAVAEFVRRGQDAEQQREDLHQAADEEQQDRKRVVVGLEV